MCQDSKNKKDVEDKDADDKKDGEGGDRKEGDEEEEAEEAVEEEEEDEDEKYKEEYRQMEHELLASCSDEEWQRYETMRCDPHLSPSMIVKARCTCFFKFWVVREFRVQAVIPSTRRALLGVETWKQNFINDPYTLDPRP